MLVVFGEFFLETVFYGLAKAPRMGFEVKTSRMSECPGGGVATTALVAARLGTSTAIVTRVGSDALQNQTWQTLAGGGVRVEACEYDPHRPTARTVCVAYAGDRMMITHDVINGQLHSLLARRRVQQTIRRARHLHLACAMWPPRAWASIIRKVRAPEVTVSADIGWNPTTLESKELPSLLRELDFLFANKTEAQAMTGKLNMAKAIRELARWTRLPVVKLGAEGCLTVRDSKLLRVSSLAVRSVDTTGAGDAFNGGFLHGYLAGWGLEKCLGAGSICGALATTGPGGSSAIPGSRRLMDLIYKLR
jgi:sugar/nucleoside kinase (ribokinase family)